MDSDGEDIPFAILHSDQSSSFSNQHYVSQSQQIEQYFNKDQKYCSKKQSPTEIISQKPYEIDNQQNFIEFSQASCKSGLFRLHPQRKKKFIQIQKKTKEKYIVCKKGNKRETSLLNINFKTFISSLLRQYMLFHSFTQYEQQKISLFFASKANFASFQKLYGVQDRQNSRLQENSKKKVIVKGEHDNLRRFLRQKLENGQFIGRIMTNRKMSYQNKISMMKFCSQIRKSCINPQTFNNWKVMGIY